MASTWSALKIELLETGQNPGTWGTLTNVNLGDAVLGEAITGSATVDFPSAADVTITLADSATTQAARNLRLNITESGAGVGYVGNLILGANCQIEKFYLINNTGTGAKTVKNTTGTGISVPAGKATLVYNNGTNVVDAASYFTSLTLGSPLPIASGGTATATPALVQGSGVTITGTWPNQTINATGTGGTVTSVAVSGGTTGLTTSGGPITTSGTITLAGTVATTNGGTGLTSFTSGGVVYASSSSVLATGSALVFDGTNLGIANASPTQKLDVAGQITISSGNGYLWGNGAVQMYSNTSYLRFRTASTDRLEIDSAGNLGLGVTPSASTLATIQSAYGITIGNNEAHTTKNAYYNSGWKYATTTTAARFSVGEGGSDFRFYTAASGTAGNAITFTQAMTLDASGNLGLGTTSPTDSASFGRALDIQSNGGGAAYFRASGTNPSTEYLAIGYSPSAAYIYNRANSPILFYANATEFARISSAGGFSVGTTANPGAGAIYATGNITAYYSSDIKFKENVRDIPDALATVNAIGGKLFDWKDDYIESKGGADGYFVQKADFGVIAQDVQKVFPIAVRTRDDGSLAVDYEKLGALAFAALVELTKRVEALEAK